MIPRCACGADKGHDYDCATACRLSDLEQEVRRLRAVLGNMRDNIGLALDPRSTPAKNEGSDG